MKDRIEQKPLTDSVFEKLRSEILHGKLKHIRARLEPFAAELAVGRLSDKQLLRLSELIQEMEALDAKTDLEKILDKNREFHYIIYSAAENETLVAIINQLWRDILRLRSQYLLTPHGHVDSTHEHRMILEALTARDRKRVYQLVQTHCEHSKITLLGVDTGAHRAEEDVTSEMAESGPPVPLATE